MKNTMQQTVINMDVRDCYWYSFAEMVYKKYYLETYKQRSIKYDKIISGFLVFASSSGIAGWAFWGKYQFVWAFIIGASQVISLIKPYMHFKEQIIAINYCLPDLQKTLIEMEKVWKQTDNMEKSDIIKAQAKFESVYNSLHSKYISSLDLPDNKKCQNTAMDKRDAYLMSYTAIAKKEVKV